MAAVLVSLDEMDRLPDTARLIDVRWKLGDAQLFPGSYSGWLAQGLPVDRGIAGAS